MIKSAISSTPGEIRLALYEFQHEELANFIEHEFRAREVYLIINPRNDKGEVENCRNITRTKPERARHLTNLHHKFVVVGNELVITGSANWSNTSMANDGDSNNIVIIRNYSIAQAFLNEFDRLWKTAIDGCN